MYIVRYENLFELYVDWDKWVVQYQVGLLRRILNLRGTSVLFLVYLLPRSV